jgi:hypothetical protein
VPRAILIGLPVRLGLGLLAVAGVTGGLAASGQSARGEGVAASTVAAPAAAVRPAHVEPRHVEKPAPVVSHRAPGRKLKRSIPLPASSPWALPPILVLHARRRASAPAAELRRRVLHSPKLLLSPKARRSVGGGKVAPAALDLLLHVPCSTRRVRACACRRPRSP